MFVLRFPKINLKAFSKKPIYRILLLLCVPAIIIVIFIFSGNLYYRNNYKSLLTTFYAKEITAFLDSIEAELISLQSDATSIVLDSNVNAFLNTHELSTLQKQQAQLVLQNKLATEPLLNSIFLLNTSNNTVISNSGMYDSDTFFNYIYK